MIITINTHYCSREELEELRTYLNDESWDFKEEVSEPIIQPKFILNDLYKINDIDIAEKVFDEELTDYRIIDVETEIDSLSRWISEARTDTTKQLMITDLKQLLATSDKYVLSSISTNHYVESDDSEFDGLCEDILAVNK